MPLIQCSNILSNWDKSFFGEYEKQDVLYIVTNGTEHKIGISSNIYSRYQSYRTNSPKPVKLEKYFSILNVRDIETLVHRYLKNLTIDSRSEWTDIDYDELESYLELATFAKAKRTIFMRGNGSNCKIWRNSSYKKNTGMGEGFFFRQKESQGHYLLEFKTDHFWVLASNSKIYDPSSKYYLSGDKDFYKKDHKLPKLSNWFFEFYLRIDYNKNKKKYEEYHFILGDVIQDVLKRDQYKCKVTSKLVEYDFGKERKYLKNGKFFKLLSYHIEHETKLEHDSYKENIFYFVEQIHADYLEAIQAYKVKEKQYLLDDDFEGI